jgi:hypothetical protein
MEEDEEDGGYAITKKEARLQKYSDLLDPDISVKPVLGKRERERFDLMQTAYHWRTTFFSPDQVRKMLMKERGERSYSSACEIYQDMEYLWGKTYEINKAALKRVQIESYYKLIQLVYKSDADDWEKAKRIESILDKISDLYGLKDGESYDPEDVMPERIIQIISSGGVQIANVEKGGGNG